MTPAEELRAAAVRIRKLAVGATPGPWDAHEEHHGVYRGEITVVRSVSEPRRRIVNVDQTFTNHEEREANVAHIAYWDPTVTILVASILDDQAEEWEEHPETMQRFVAAPNGDDPSTASPVYLLARAINGGQS